MSFEQKAVILNGLARGGTNIIWNILQSHPNVVSPVYEVNQIIGTRSFLTPLKPLLVSNPIPSLAPLINRFVHRRFTSYKLKNLAIEDNRYKTENTPYSPDEVHNATLCIKGVCSANNWDIDYSDLLYQSFPQVFFIGLVRNGYAICEGWKRRGVSPKKAGKLYARYVDQLVNDQARYPDYKIIKFEDALQAPFAVAETLFGFIQETPTAIPKLRIKVKKTVNLKQKHRTHYGELNRKYWFSQETIGEIIKPDINHLQVNGLSEQEKAIFKKEAQEALKYFSYE
uniref:Sulfotransferase n=1 Tax=Roseihalotalea indica TaxID=2867963 RepID=A0AA49GQC8_9BACT|nr:hypothetical protein K4G66_04510 [Tunicatimonas sp. TK19036]